MLCARHLLHVPRLLVLDHGIEHRQELAHTGQRDLCSLPRSPQTLVKRFEYWIIAHRHQGTHVQGGPHMGASPPGRPTASEGTAIAIQGRHADQGSQALAA